jgi:hypothetical protein
MINEEKICQWHILNPDASKCTRVASRPHRNETTLEETFICEPHFIKLGNMRVEETDKWLKITGQMTPLQQAAASVREEVRKCVEKLSQNYPELNLCTALLGEAELSQARLSEDDEKKAKLEAKKIYGDEAEALRRKRNRP